MAEPQRASSLPDVASRPRHRPHHAELGRTALDETENLSPPFPAARPEAPPQPAGQAPIGGPEPRKQRRKAVPHPPSRSPGEWTLLAVVLLGLALNASALLAGSALTPADRHLGTAVLLAGIALLVLMEICRRSGGDAR